jgi:hypothetical protein
VPTALSIILSAHARPRMSRHAGHRLMILRGSTPKYRRSSREVFSSFDRQNRHPEIVLVLRLITGGLGACKKSSSVKTYN